MILCQRCRQEVDPTDDDVLRAFPQQTLQAMGSGPERVDGVAVAFHRSCYPTGSPHYRLAPKPEH